MVRLTPVEGVVPREEMDSGIGSEEIAHIL
jgi:hypothetical protein